MSESNGRWTRARALEPGLPMLVCYDHGKMEHCYFTEAEVVENLVDRYPEHIYFFITTEV